jgi:hypothetical protein
VIKIKLTKSDREELGLTMFNQTVIDYAKIYKIQYFEVEYKIIKKRCSDYALIIDSCIEKSTNRFAELIQSKFVIGANTFNKISHSNGSTMMGMPQAGGGSFSLAGSIDIKYTFYNKDNNLITLMLSDYGIFWFVVENKYL